MLYRPSTPPTTTISTIAGKSLAHRKFTPAQAGAIGAQILLGEAVIEPTVEQAATLVGVCAAIVRRAARLTPEQRASYASGAVTGPLPPPPPAAVPRPPTLHEAWFWASPAEQVAFARSIGIERCWSKGGAR